MVDGLKPYPKYKPSRLPWLKQIPAHWDENRAKCYFREVDERSASGQEELLSVSHITGVTPRSQKNVTMFKAESYVGHKLCQPGDLVVNTMWAWMAAMGVAKQGGLVSPSYATYRLRSRGAYVPEFVDLLLRTSPYRTEYVCRSTGIRTSRLRLYPEKFLDIPLVCPPRDEQVSIANYLANVGALVAKFVRAKRRQIDLLEEHKRAVIRTLVFGGRDAACDPQASNPAWLDSIPAHWQRARLGYLAGFETGGTPSTNQAEYWNGDIAWVSSKDMKVAWISDTQAHITAQAIANSSSKMVPTGALLMVVRSGILRRHIPVAVTSCPVAINQDIKAILLRGDRLLPEYLREVISAYERTLLQIWRKQGATVESIEHGPLANTYFPIPPTDEQRRILGLIRSSTSDIMSAQHTIERQIGLVREHRTRLVADVVTGRFDVRELDAAPLETDVDVDADGADAGEQSSEELEEAAVGDE